MDWQQILNDGYLRVLESMNRIMEGLSREDLDWQPRPDCNSMGWTFWHLSRQQDAQISALTNMEQLWLKEKWYEKFKRAADADDTGFGDSPEEVAAFRSPAKQVLLDYQKAVVSRSQEYFTTLSGSDLDRQLDEPWFNPRPTLGVRLMSILGDSLMHIGQAAYIRGLRQGKGWQTF